MTIASLQKWIGSVQPLDNSNELARDCFAWSKFSEEQVIYTHLLLEHQSHLFISSYPTRRFSLLIPLSLSCALDTLAGDGDGNGCTTDNIVDLDAA